MHALFTTKRKSFRAEITIRKNSEEGGKQRQGLWFAQYPEWDQQVALYLFSWVPRDELSIGCLKGEQGTLIQDTGGSYFGKSNLNLIALHAQRRVGCCMAGIKELLRFDFICSFLKVTSEVSPAFPHSLGVMEIKIF